MGFMTGIKASKALKLHQQGKLEEAKALYEEVLKEGCMDAKTMLSYAILLIREGSYDTAKRVLVKCQNAPGITPSQLNQVYIDFSACCLRQGDPITAVAYMEKRHPKFPTESTYETLGYMYVEKYANKPAVLPEPPKPLTDEDPILTAEEAWQQGQEKALAFLKESVDYDDEDPITLDNLGQFYFRVLKDKAAAREWFDKAHAIKPSQIDTLWFLSRYDLDAGDKAAALEKLETMLEGRFSILNCITKADVEAEITRIKAE